LPGGLLPDSSSMILFLLATVTLNLTPGPDMLYVIANSVSGGRKAGVLSALGVGTGCIVHTVAAALGLSALLMSSSILYDIFRFVGAAYLIFMGIRSLSSKAALARSTQRARVPLARSFRQGVATNVLNPKVAMFFLAFLPQFVDPTRGSAVWQFILLGTIFNASGTVVNTVVALVSGQLGSFLGKRPVLSRAQQWFTGGVFVALGARIALAGRG
jgi:threonine/homoserine/homoserine lactone efflux protein